MKKIFFLNLLLLCSVCAQDLHEFSISGGGGFSSLMYGPSLGKQNEGFDAHFGLGYSFFVSSMFGFTTGLEFASYNATFKLNNFKMQYQATDLEEGVDFMFHSTLNRYKETQNISMLQIPLMLQFQTNGKYKLYFAAGAKAAIPMSGSHSGSGDVINSGYYEEEDFEYTKQGFRGFGTYKDKKIEGKDKFKSSFLAAMEMGMKWRFNDGISIYVGAYFDYGFSNIFKKQDVEKLPQMVEYNSENPPDFAMNGVLNSQWKNNNASQAFVTKIMPMAIGLKAKVAFGHGVDHYDFAKKEETKRLEEEKLQQQANLARIDSTEKAEAHKRAERIAEAKALLEDARLTYEKAQREQEIRAMSIETKRLAAEKAQLEQEIARLSAIPPVKDTLPAMVIVQTPLVQETPAQKVPAQEASIQSSYVVQVAVILDEARAKLMVNSLNQNGFNSYYKRVSNPGRLSGIYYRVRVGYFKDFSEADNFAKTKLSQSYSGWWIDKTENDTRSYLY